MSVRESRYQAHVIARLRAEFPGCFILKNDSAYLQGIPDLLILFNEHWAMLEVKASARSRTQPNQEYYVDLLDEMSFAAFIFPENEEEVFCDLQYALSPKRPARVSKR
jgi:hypothetical protein